MVSIALLASDLDKLSISFSNVILCVLHKFNRYFFCFAVIGDCLGICHAKGCGLKSSGSLVSNSSLKNLKSSEVA